jgi:hypothetical protein
MNELKKKIKVFSIISNKTTRYLIHKTQTYIHIHTHTHTYIYA